MHTKGNANRTKCCEWIFHGFFYSLFHSTQGPVFVFLIIRITAALTHTPHHITSHRTFHTHANSVFIFVNVCLNECEIYLQEKKKKLNILHFSSYLYRWLRFTREALIVHHSFLLHVSIFIAQWMEDAERHSIQPFDVVRTV